MRIYQTRKEVAIRPVNVKGILGRFDLVSWTNSGDQSSVDEHRLVLQNFGRRHRDDVHINESNDRKPSGVGRLANGNASIREDQEQP